MPMMIPSDRDLKREDTPAFFCSEGSDVDPTLIPPVDVGEGNPVVYACK